MSELTITTLENLITVMKDNNIDVSLYGRKNSKSVEALFSEIENGETVLLVNGEKLVRKVIVLNLVIRSNGLVLREKWQKHFGKERRERKCLLAEKIMKNELQILELVIKRAINEELGSLGLNLQLKIDLDSSAIAWTNGYSQSYPELNSCYEFHIIPVDVVGLPENDFITTEYEKNNPSQLRLTTAWEWVTEDPCNFNDVVKNYFAKK